jgi:ubiquinone/menaquinone biosynthesis C-methylase UbiE
MTPTSPPATLFDRWSATYDRPGLQLFTYRPIHDAVLARLGALEPSTVVDLGCGTGQLTQRLTQRFPDASIVGVDLSDGMLTEAAGRLREVGGGDHPLVRADALHLPFATSSVDLVVCTESFHWYPDQSSALHELARVVNCGGRLLIASIATVTGVGDRLLRRATGAGGRTIRALPPHRMRQLLARSGFDVITQRRVPRLGPIAWPVLTDARRH